jgi:hypothetical protein
MNDTFAPLILLSFERNSFLKYLILSADTLISSDCASSRSRTARAEKQAGAFSGGCRDSNHLNNAETDNFC